MKFSRKASLRESWLTDMSQVLDELDKGQDVHAVDAALKRHEAISADVHGGVSNNLKPRPSVISQPWRKIEFCNGKPGFEAG